MPSHTRPTTYVPGSFLRPCDVCGIRFLSDQLVRGADGKFRCRRWCTEITNLEVDKLKAQSHKRKESPPPPHATPWVRGDLAAEEAPIFQAMAELRVKDGVWPAGVREGYPPESQWSVRGAGAPGANGGYTVQAAAWACIYLGAVYVENRRPNSWMVSAKRKLRELGDWLLSRQLTETGTGDFYLDDHNAAWYGGWLRQSEMAVYSEDVGAGCMALTRAYQATNDSKYIVAAGRAVGCINRLMNGDKLTSYFTSSDGLGAVRWHAGMVSHRVLLDQAPG